MLPEDADNKTLRWSSDSPSIVSVTVDEDTHSATVKGVSEGEAIITAAATDGSGVSAMCNVVVKTPPLPADYYVKSVQYYTLNDKKEILFRNTDDTEDLTFSQPTNRSYIYFGKYNGSGTAIDIYLTINFNQKAEYLIRSIEDDGYIKLKRAGASYEIWIYRDNNVFERLKGTLVSNLVPSGLTERLTYVGDIENPYKYIDYYYNSRYCWVNYDQIGSRNDNYAAYVASNGNITLNDPIGTVSINKADITDKSFELTTVKDDITTKDLYAFDSTGGSSYAAYDVHYKIQTKDGGYIYYGQYGSSLDPATYPYDTISKTHTWSVVEPETETT